jgi:hypothetical protein
LPMIVFARRPPAEWTADAGTRSVAALAERWVALDNSAGGAVSHPVDIMTYVQKPFVADLKSAR